MSMTVLYYPEVSKFFKVIIVLCAVATMVIKVELLTPPTIRAVHVAVGVALRRLQRREWWW